MNSEFVIDGDFDKLQDCDDDLELHPTYPGTHTNLWDEHLAIETSTIYEMLDMDGSSYTGCTP